MHAVASLENINGHALGVARILYTMEPRAIGLDVTRAIERLGDELVARFRGGLVSREIVTRRKASRKLARIVDVHRAPEDVDLDGAQVLVVPVAERVEERLADHAQGNFRHFSPVQRCAIDDEGAPNVVQDIELGGIDQREDRTRLLVVVEDVKALRVGEHAHAEHDVARGHEASRRRVGERVVVAEETEA